MPAASLPEDDTPTAGEAVDGPPGLSEPPSTAEQMYVLLGGVFFLALVGKPGSLFFDTRTLPGV